MQAFYEVNSCDSEAGSAAKGGVERIYYLAAEKVQWNYTPSGKDLINNVSLTEAERWAESFFSNYEQHTSASSLSSSNSREPCLTQNNSKPYLCL